MLATIFLSMIVVGGRLGHTRAMARRPTIAHAGRNASCRTGLSYSPIASSHSPSAKRTSYLAIAHSCRSSMVDLDSAEQYPRLDARRSSHGARNLRRQPRYDPERPQFQLPIRKRLRPTLGDADLRPRPHSRPSICSSRSGGRLKSRTLLSAGTSTTANISPSRSRRARKRANPTPPFAASSASTSSTM